MKKLFIFFSLIFLFSCGNTDTTNIETKAFANKKTAIFLYGKCFRYREG